MSNRVVWTPSTDSNIATYNLQSSLDASAWTTIATITHNITNPAVYDSSVGMFYYVDSGGAAGTWYRVNAVDSLGQASAWSSPFQAGAVVPMGYYGFGGQMALSQLMSFVRSESDTQNDPHIADDELSLFINQSRMELYDLLVTSFGDDYYTASASIPLVAGTDTYGLPDGSLYAGARPYYKGLLVEATSGPMVAPGQPITLRKMNLRDKNRYNLPQLAAMSPFMLPRYRVFGANIMFAPVPSSSMTVKVYYAPKLLPLSALTDVAEDWSGWLEYVIVDAAIKCVAKQDRDANVLMARKNALLSRIRAAAANRDLGEPNTVVETGGDSYFGGYSGGGPFGGGGIWG